MDRNSQKYLKRRKSQARFCFPLDWLDISERKIIEKCNYGGAGAHNIEKVVSFCPTLKPNLPIFGEGKKGKFHMLKKVRLSILKEIL